MMRKLRNLFISFLFIFVGCQATPKVDKVELNERAKEVEKVLADASKDDTLVIYHLMSGIKEYVSRYEGVQKNSQAFNLFKVVKERYGKEAGFLDKDGPDNDMNDILEKNLLKLGMDTPQDFTETSRAEFVKLFEDCSSGALSAYRSKK